jgi:hypothetical protein
MLPKSAAWRNGCCWSDSYGKEAIRVDFRVTQDKNIPVSMSCLTDWHCWADVISLKAEEMGWFILLPCGMMLPLVQQGSTLSKIGFWQEVTNYFQNFQIWVGMRGGCQSGELSPLGLLQVRGAAPPRSDRGPQRGTPSTSDWTSFRLPEINIGASGSKCN